MKYAYAILDDTSQGHLKPLPINSKVINSEIELPFKQILLTFAIAAANVSIYRNFGATTAAITGSISMFAFPANVMVLAVERSFFAAFNPVIILSFMRRIGAAYFLLALFLLLLTSASGKMMQLLYEASTETNFIVISSFINMYFLLIMYHLMGYVLYQYHEQLGLSIDESETEKPKDTKPALMNQLARNPELRHFEILIQEGKTDEANNKITQIIRDNPADNEARMLDLKLQKLLGNMDIYEKNAKKYIRYLFEKEQINDAVKVLSNVLLTVPKFKPESAIERLTLAKGLKQSGQNKAAVSLINNLHIDFPKFDAIPEAYLMAATVLRVNCSPDTNYYHLYSYY